MITDIRRNMTSFTRWLRFLAKEHKHKLNQHTYSRMLTISWLSLTFLF